MTSTQRIAIVGAGPAGLVCARVLQARGLAATVYDLDESRSARPQGGTLDMHADSGQEALRAAGLLEQFHALARPEGQQMRLLAPDGTVLLDESPGAEDGYNPEIDRGQLRDLLLDSLEPGTVQWGAKVSAVTATDEASALVLADGTTVEADLVVGADGAWSRVRRLLSPAVPAYTGVTFVEATLADVAVRQPEVAALVGDGTMMALADNKGLIAQRTANGAMRTYIGVRLDEQWHARFGVDLADDPAVRDLLASWFAGWDPRLQRLITEHDGPYVNRPLYALPVPHTWAHRPGVTLVGDAAHLMSPFSGMGANLAMLDGAELAESIASHASVDDAVIAYEKVMLERSAEAATGAAEGIATAFSPDSTQRALAHFAAPR